VKKSLILVAMLSTGLFINSAVFASQEAMDEQQPQATNSEEVVAMCEDKFNVDKYSDDEERNSLIDTCINENSDSTKTTSDEG
jgi:hypothetical protein